MRHRGVVRPKAHSTGRAPRRRTAGFALTLLLLGVCGAGGPGCTEGTPPGRGRRVVKVGVIYPFSGPKAATGKDLKAGVELARDLVNEVFDLDLPLARQKGLFDGAGRLEIVFRDSRSDPAAARREVKELATSEGVAAILGAYSSTATAAASETAEVLQVPFVNAASTSPVLTGRGLKWFFRTTPDDEIFAENFFAFLFEMEARRAASVPRRIALVYENRLWGTGVAQAERRLAEKYGYEVVADVPYDAGDRSFDAELEVVAAQPDCVLMQASYVRDAVGFMRGYKARGIRPAAILAMDGGFISPEFLETLGPDGEYVFSREVWAKDLAEHKPIVGQVNRLFRERFGKDMTGNSARAFTGMLVLADAIHRAGGDGRRRIREALRATEWGADQVVMPWGGVAFHPRTGQNTRGRGIIVQVLEGRYVTVWPEDLAAREPVWPMPSWALREASP
ncbi:MAG: ABC transporter substrate-binding protein [Deferrisomatales bacterium]